jgi:uncharacterized protein
MKTQQQWRRFNGKRLTLSIYDEVKNVLQQAAQNYETLRVCIGTDSQVKSRETEFATVIVFYRKGKGGFMYISKETSIAKMSIKERMLREVAMSIDVAYTLTDLFVQYNVDMEIHADINTNPNFKSNAALRDATGYILGMGFAFKAKPEAFASSSCANKMVQ